MQLLFLAWESPWPARSGGDLRTWGLLKELGEAFDVELVVLSRRPLSEEQRTTLRDHVSTIHRVPASTRSARGRLRILGHMVLSATPYHCAVIEISFHSCADLLKRVLSFPGVVYASYSHWGTLVRGQDASNWILDQQNADVDFWRIYASQTRSYLRKAAAWVNWGLATRYFPGVYSSVGRIISVCEEDKRITEKLAGGTPVDVIENGVDCSYYSPDPERRNGDRPRLLFTGTSVPRNVTALRCFVREILPLIEKEVPDVELLVGGNFVPPAQVEFRAHSNIKFTGWVEDIRPCFDRSDVFVAPFEETQGSKLKIAEAMAMGMSIVSTPQGVRGFDLVDGESVLIARDDRQFACRTIELLQHPEKREALGAAARRTAVSTIDWEVLGSRLVDIIHRQFAAL